MSPFDLSSVTIPLLPFLTLVVALLTLGVKMVLDYGRQTETLKAIQAALVTQTTTVQGQQEQIREIQQGLWRFFLIITLLVEGQPAAAKLALQSALGGSPPKDKGAPEGA